METPEEIKKGLECCSVEAMHCGPEDPKCAYDCGSEECIRNLMHDALAYIKQLEAQVPKWISVEDRMPGAVESVLCIVRYGEDVFDYELGYFLRNKWYRAGRRNGVATHWMPLPEPPKEEES